MRFRETKDGRLFVPRRGKPPQPPEGYEQSRSSKYFFVPKIGRCKYLKVVSSGCCGNSHSICTACDKIIKVNYRICKQCKGDKQWILNYQTQKSG